MVNKTKPESLARLLPANEAGRDIIVGDVHGCFTELCDLLKLCEYDFGDRLFLLGDLTDRGLESEKALEWTKRAICIRGNHEQVQLDYMEGYADHTDVIGAGGRWFLKQTSTWRDRYYRAIIAMPYAIEITTPKGLVGLVHANCPLPDWNRLIQRLQRISRNSGTRKFLESIVDVRQRLVEKDTTEIQGVHRILVGHAPVEKAGYQLGNVIYLDTGAVNGCGLSACIIDQSGDFTYHTVPTTFVPDD